MSSTVRTDLVLNPFNATMAEMVAAAQIADQGGFDTVWTFDHFSGIVVGANWSRHPFVVLGAIAASTTRIRLGVLVANIANRPPAQLGSAINSLQDLAGRPVTAGIGAGAGPGSQFGAEQVAVGRPLKPASTRRGELIEYVHGFRSLWDASVEPPALARVTDPTSQRPPVVIGASHPLTIGLAAREADGVNIRASDNLAQHISQARHNQLDDSFEVSVYDRLDLDHLVGGDPAPLEALGVDRRTLAINPPYDLDRLGQIAVNLSQLT